MKKFIASLLAAALLLTLTVGCGDTTPKATVKDKESAKVDKDKASVKEKESATTGKDKDK